MFLCAIKFHIIQPDCTKSDALCNKFLFFLYDGMNVINLLLYAKKQRNNSIEKKNGCSWSF